MKKTGLFDLYFQEIYIDHIFIVRHYTSTHDVKINDIVLFMEGRMHKEELYFKIVNTIIRK